MTGKPSSGRSRFGNSPLESMKKVLFIRPRKATDAHAVPHLGLAMLTAVLRSRGHEVLVLDHMLYLGGELPPLAGLIADFRPDVIGVTMYTATARECSQVLDEIAAVTDKPIIVGGPHAAIYTDELAADPRISCIVRGEAESTIAAVVEGEARRSPPMVVDPDPPDVNELPPPDFSSFLNRERAKIYPLVTSRGCPFGCSFCVVEQVSTRHWRARPVEACLAELEAALRTFPALELIKVSDDCPTLDLGRFKSFLRGCIERKFPLPMTIDNTRADRIDAEFVRLAKQAGNSNLCVAVEHGDPEVFGRINKGESLETIKNAARLIRENGMELRLCFVIGLPGDTLERTRRSIELAKELGPMHIYWNMAHPMRGTAIRRWYEENGAVIKGDSAYTSYDTHSLRLREPAVETPDFSAEDRGKAYFMAAVGTDQYHFTPEEVRLLLVQGFRYGLPLLSVLSLLRQSGKWLVSKFRSAAGRLGGRR